MLARDPLRFSAIYRTEVENYLNNSGYMGSETMGLRPEFVDFRRCAKAELFYLEINEADYDDWMYLIQPTYHIFKTKITMQKTFFVLCFIYDTLIRLLFFQIYVVIQTIIEKNKNEDRHLLSKATFLVTYISFVFV